MKSQPHRGQVNGGKNHVDPGMTPGDPDASGATGGLPASAADPTRAGPVTNCPLVTLSPPFSLRLADDATGSARATFTRAFPQPRRAANLRGTD